MSILYQKKAQKRTIIVAFSLVFWLSILMVRLVQLQVFEHVPSKTVVMSQNQIEHTIHPKRGTIFDCTGNILARTIPSQSVYYAPLEGEPYFLQLEKINQLQKALDLSENELKKITGRIEKKSTFIWIKRKVSPEEEKKVRTLSLGGIHFLEENKRFYPKGKLAAHLLGRVDIDQNGATGIEYRYDSELKGKKGKYLILKDARKKEYRFDIQKEPEAGKDIILAIDETIQYYVEIELEKAIHNTGAAWGTVIISQPATGRILAMANYPTYDLNNLPSNPIPHDRNPAIHHNVEPGSTFKIVTASTALEEKKVKLNEIINCSKMSVQIGKKVIKDYKQFGFLSFPQVIAYSSNVGTIQIGQRLDVDRFYTAIRDFGFGQKTGIDLPAEEKGIFKHLDDWEKSSPVFLSIGYEILATPIQILQALNIIANKGYMITPRVVIKILDSSKRAKERLPKWKKIISEKTASKIISILEMAVAEGTGKEAQLERYKVAGKTGTTQNLDPSTGSYSTSVHTSSFVGFVPADDPAISMIVVIAEPEGPYYGGEVAAPVFREIASSVLRYLHIPPQRGRPNILAENRWRQNER
jgi:cell division protein FtsI (penicillin-binding protein 3)